MSKRKLEDELEADWNEPKFVAGPKKNSLDSDEEDDVDEKHYDILAADDIEGQEEATADFDGEIRITPFNMKEELEEGHFDTEGNYHWKKDEKVIKDHWLDNIDWIKIKPKNPGEGSSDDESGDEDGPFDDIVVYKKMLEFMKPGETVAKSLRRLGGNKTMSASERWRRKKAGEDVDTGNKEQMLELTDLANKVLNGCGNMDIYQESYEYITKKIEDADKKKTAPPVAPRTNYDDALDMYSDDFDEKEKARLQSSTGTSEASKSTAAESSSSKNEDDNDEVMWEFKWKQDNSEVHGPHTTSQMQAWVKEGYFKSEVWVRKRGQDGPFYTSRRIDFELYL